MAKERASLSRPPSLPDVAKLAGVSVSTAARVIRRDPVKVSPDLAARVESAVEELGYVPNIMAQGLRHGRVASVGLVVSDILDPYFGEIAEAVTIEANAHSLLAMVSNMQRDQQIEFQQCRSLWEHRVTGLILAAGSYTNSEHNEELNGLLKRIQDSGTVVVALAPRDSDVPTIAVDNEDVGRMIAQRLLDAGHRRIGVIGGERNNLTQRLRLQGIESTLASAGITPVVVNADYSTHAGIEGTVQVLQVDPGTTAFIGGSDQIAYGIVQRLQEMGRRVPEDVSVIGIGNTRLSKLMMPQLTTVDVKLAESGRAAVAYIAAARAGEEPSGSTTLQATFVEGGTLVDYTG